MKKPHAPHNNRKQFNKRGKCSRTMRLVEVRAYRGGKKTNKVYFIENV